MNPVKVRPLVSGVFEAMRFDPEYDPDVVRWLNNHDLYLDPTPKAGSFKVMNLLHDSVFFVEPGEWIVIGNGHGEVLTDHAFRSNYTLVTNKEAH